MSIAAVSRPAGVRLRAFYAALSILMSIIVLVGFWPSYFGPLLHGITARPLVVQIHGIVFVGWMLLLITQVLLAGTGRIRAHRKVGNFGIAYGFLVLLLGTIVSFAAPVVHVRAGEWDMDRAAAFLLIPLGDMVLFGSLFGIAVAYRDRPEIHKRFILAATVALLFAAVGRMTFIPSPWLLVLLWLSPLFIGMAYDLLTRRRVHAAYVISLGMLLAGFSRVFVNHSAAWLRIGRAVFKALV